MIATRWKEVGSGSTRKMNLMPARKTFCDEVETKLVGLFVEITKWKECGCGNV